MSDFDDELHFWLRQWVLRAVQHITRAVEPLRNADASDASDAILGSLWTVSTALKEAVWQRRRVHPLCTLPRPVVCRIWSHLTLRDTAALRKVSRDLRVVLPHTPEIWSDVSLPSSGQGQTRGPVVLYWQTLAVFVDLSVAEPLRVSLFTWGEEFLHQAPVLACHMPRMELLSLTLTHPCGEDGRLFSVSSGESWSSLLLLLMTEPAPQLTSLHLSSCIGNSPLSAYDADDLLTLTFPLFSGVAPRLRRCRLASVSLPPAAYCDAFRNVTVFSYHLQADMNTRTITHISEVMPRLEMLELTAFAFRAGDGDAKPASTAPLRCLMCKFALFEAPDVSYICPIGKLRELWIPEHIMKGAVGTETLCRSAVLGMCLPWSGATVAMEVAGDRDGVTTHLFVSHHLLYSTNLSVFLSPFPQITWLALHEHLWDIDSEPPPPLPKLTVLCVRLAPRCEYAPGDGTRDWWWLDPAGLFTAELGYQWTLPSLRAVHLSAPPEADRALCPQRQRCCAHPLSVALLDVARWVARGLVFDATLETVVLCGLRVVDHDFCAAWDALLAHSKNIELTETLSGDWQRYYFSSDAVDYRTRAASIFQQ